MVHLYNSTYTATAGNKSRFILSEKSDFHMIDNLSIATHDFAKLMLTSLSVDEILLLRYVNLSNNFKGLSLNDFFSFKVHELYLFTFVLRPMRPAAYYRLIELWFGLVWF